MKCPNDGNTLLITERSGIEIDYCPECRGVWLDRGELDKLIDRGAGTVQPSEPAAHPNSEQPPYRNHGYRDHDDDHYKKRRKESFLGDLFDF